MMTRSWSKMTVSLFLVALLSGCAGDDPSSAEKAGGLYLEGLLTLYGAMENVDLDSAPWDWDVDVDPALAQFEEALEYDPDHCGALLGSALTRVLSVITDPELREILSRLFPREDGSAARALLWFARPPDVVGLASQISEQRDNFHFSELQLYLEDVALPSLGVADERLTRFEHLGCQVDLIITIPDDADSVGQLVPVEIDVTDAYFAHAALDVIQAVAHALTSYDVDVDDGQTLQYLIESDPDFLTLRAGGHLPSAFDEIGSAGLHLIDALDALENETDDQSDDLVTQLDGHIELDDLLGEGSLEGLRELADGVDAALSQGLEVNPADFEPGAPDVYVLIDLDELMNDPLADMRPYLPEHTWPRPDSMHITAPASFPDPTMDGITPGMTNESWGAILEWLQDRF